MNDQDHRDKLEQELRFLKESYEAEVINKEEYEKGKERVEQKLKDVNAGQQQNDDNFFEKTEKKEENKQAETIKPQEELKSVEEKRIESKKTVLTDKKENKLFKYAVVFVVLALIVFFSYSLFKPDKDAKDKNQVKFVAVCNSNEDCKQNGQDGICINPGQKDAKCEIKQIQKTNVVVLNGRKDCFNCDTQRVLSILETWFGALNTKEIDYETDEGKKFAEITGVKLLPAYILEENITNNAAFDQFKQAFAKRNNYYILSENAAGSTFYFNRENVPNRLDLFLIFGDAASVKAENNLKEFLAAFSDVKFEKHSSDDQLTQELGIKTFPTFLVNNRVKFTGIQTSETIKENYCKLNKVDECKKSLSKNLV